MKNKKIIIAVVFAALLAIGIIALIIAHNQNKVGHEMYEKYSLAITIDAIGQEEIDSIFINVSDDGNSAKISSNKVNLDSYIIGNKLYYLKDNTFYIYETSSSYSDIYEYINAPRSLDKIKESNDYAYYSTLLSAKEINELLDCLFFSKKTRSEAVAKITVKDDNVVEFSITISDIDGYKDITIDIFAEKLSDEFTVDTSKIYGYSSGPNVNIIKRQTTKENVYEIIK